MGTAAENTAIGTSMYSLTYSNANLSNGTVLSIAVTNFTAGTYNLAVVSGGGNVTDDSSDMLNAINVYNCCAAAL